MPMENQSIQPPEFPGHAPESAGQSSPVPQASAEFRTMPKAAEVFGRLPQISERKENHTLTVKEVARMFEAAGVSRTERSIINWCQPNRQGIARLDSYFDPNERKYYITPPSVEAAIQEELQRRKKSDGVPVSESFGSPVAHVKHPENSANPTNRQKFQELELEILDLKITNRAKDMFIEQLKNERADFFDRLLPPNRTLGNPEHELRQISK